MPGEQRFVISVRIIGAVRRDAPKLKMFMMTVLWSDETEVIVYRSFKDFQKFHKQLKKRLALMGNERVIPKFKGKARSSSLQQKGPQRCVQRMKVLESYCDKLLKCEPTVTQSSELTQFFMPKDQDLQPDFTKNSIMILLSDDLSNGPGGGGGGAVTQQKLGSVTHPFVTQTYRCMAAYETKDTNNRPFKVAVNEKLDVLIKDPAGWWLVENENRRMAWFPAPYLELWDEEEEEDDFGFQSGDNLYRAVRSYTATTEDEVSVSIGSVVEVLRKSDNGWWLIRFNGKGGYIPSMYLQPYNNPLYSLQRKLYSSTLNLVTSGEPHASDKNSLQLDSADKSRQVPGLLHKARSLDVLSETWPQAQAERVPSQPDRRDRSMTNTSNGSSFSGLSSRSGSSTSLKVEAQDQPQDQPQHADITERELSRRCSSSTSSESSESSESITSKGSKTASVAPRVPPRPKTNEILTRCTTMTRKAALATKTRLHTQPVSIHSR